MSDPVNIPMPNDETVRIDTMGSLLRLTEEILHQLYAIVR